MTDSQDTASPVGVCPYLGTVHDPTTPCMFVTTAHRCFSGKGAGSISAEHQAGYCISGEHMRCARFVDTGGVPVRAR
ncbi:MAG: hypothetical protein M1380_01725, partial [Chloroflexi bacterium]|nr:hypothetical protein [Chloroflexota bacterium]